MHRHFPRLLLIAVLALQAVAGAQVVINEIQYHPVEKPHFDANGISIFSDTGQPADISSDVHEFVELQNTGASAVDLTGWTLTGGIAFTFPAGTTIAAGGFRVIARNPSRLATVYPGIPTAVLGPFTGTLSNNGDTVTLLHGDVAVDSVSYTPNFPWAISANALGAGDDFTGLDSAAYEYKGRSLQRVSATASSNDPANWVAVRTTVGGGTFADLPTPGAANIVTRSVPKPVVVAYTAVQLTDNAPIIRANVQVKVTCSFSSTASLSGVIVEYFLDNMNAFGEARNTVAMTALGNGQYTATLPGQIDRTIVRWRIKANRGDGVELVAPRADDPAVVPVGPQTYSATPAPPNAAKKIPGAREAWYAYFVTPVRSSTKPIIDMIVSTDGSAVDDNAANNTTQFNGLNGFQAMAWDCKGSPKRATAQDTSFAYPRETPYVLASDRIWEDTVPAVFVSNGVLRDIQIRFHRSRWNRLPSWKSFKVFFPDYAPYQDVEGNYVTSIFETNHDDSTLTAHRLHEAAGLPVSPLRYVDWYFNNDTVLTRLEQGEYNGVFLDAYFAKQQRLNPGSTLEATGEYYKSVGYFTNGSTNNLLGEGPYGNGNEWQLPAAGYWTELQRFDYTYSLQNHYYKGAAPIRDLINGMWAARGDTVAAPNPNLTNLKAWFNANWDVDTTLTAMALGNWLTSWDDTTQNHFLYRHANGKWFRILWDFDSMYGTGDNTGSASSLYLGEVGLAAVYPGNNFRGPNYVKDSFIKAFRTELNQRFWLLNNTLFDPENLQTLTYTNGSGTSTTYYNYIQSVTSPTTHVSGFALGRFNSVNSQVALGIFYKPTRPTNTSPATAAAVLPGANFTASAYVYNAAYTHTAAPSTSPHTSSKWEIRLATSTYDYPVYIATSTTNKTSLPIPFANLTFGQTYYWRVTYYDADGHPSITSAETSFSYGPTSTVAGNISLNEVMAENHTAVANGGGYPDYVELKNNTGAPIDISGWGLTDDDFNLNKYVFPGGTTVPANGYLVIWCDSAFTASGLHSGFAIDSDGQRVLLTQAGVLKDVVTFGPQAADLSLGRIADGTGAWTLNVPTPGAANVAKSPLGVVTNLKINEWMANPAGGSDWFEIYNSDANPVALSGLYLSDTPGNPTITQIPPLAYIAGKGYAKFFADGTTVGFNHMNFKLSNGGSPLVITNTNGTSTIDSVTFGAQARNVSQGRFPDGSATIVSFPQSPSRAYTNWLPISVVINEALTNSTTPLVDTIELFNPTASPVDISGWWLSNDKYVPQKYHIPAATTIPAGGYLVFNETQFNPTPGVGSSFSLDSFGDEVVLSAVDGTNAPTGYRAQVAFGAAADGVPFGRIVTTSAVPEFWPLTARTFNAANAAPKIGPVIINEIMYHPVDLGGLDNVRDEFIELHNITTNPIDLSGWKIQGGSSFTFAAATTLRPGDYIVVVGFDPVTDTSSLNAFRSAYGMAASVPIYGPFTPKLSNGSTNIELTYPGPAVAGVVPYILVDRAEYWDSTPWPSGADGTGNSLQRQSRTTIGNAPSNWIASAATPGIVNTGEAPILDSDGDGLPDAWEIANGLDRFNAADAAADSDGDGRTNLQEYIAGTDPQSAASFLVATPSVAVGGGCVIHFIARAGRSYTIQWRASLTAGAWQNLTNIAAPASDTATDYTDSTGDAQRFYRLVTPQQ